MGLLSAEDGIVARLKEAAAGKARTVDSLPGDWDDDMMKRFLALTPCLLVAFAGGVPPNVGEVQPSIGSEWLVYVGTGHASGQAARRRGDSMQAGAYELMEFVVIPALHGYKVPEVGTLVLTGVDNVWTGSVERQGLAVYAVRFRLQLDFGAAPAEEALSVFETFDAQYDIPPMSTEAEHRKWLAGDYGTTRPDAQDHVDLPQS